jgi:hypothetical protein
VTGRSRIQKVDVVADATGLSSRAGTALPALAPGFARHDLQADGSAGDGLPTFRGGDPVPRLGHAAEELFVVGTQL